MEVALSLPFLESKILFSLLYDNYEKNLMEELWLVHKNMDLSMTEIMNMATYMRRSYIQIHNKIIHEENEKNKEKNHL
jgi:hypothetical protein